MKTALCSAVAALCAATLLSSIEAEVLSTVSLEAEAPGSPGSILPPAEDLGRPIFTATLGTAWLNVAWPGLGSPVD
ncbi:hypothetical protein EK904_013830 [Melospiza melodia maxima]|nr:hypothetical protein EK904_013830 [Melospiza melodia maxima]